ncbi:YdcF family protein [Sphingobacterium oryzagri]|uniref:YdcF family protein n=1 Tax=Sphingobacterium oryzagri TaxID=3025669 RepID=A0ABY7WI13_9SPHI|nr:YdcF family protein [Sphingobacterium sp. KACC 22765]WDF68813.1 YdcF family protein [Sphingobacterium sp. KACC 22765]
MGNLLKAIILTLVLSCSQLTQAQDYFHDKTPQDWVIAKNYYASYILSQDSLLLTAILADDPTFQQLLTVRQQRYTASAGCKELACMLHAFKWSNAEIDALTAAFLRRLAKDKKLTALLQEKLMPSHTYGVSTGMTIAAYFEKALRQDCKAMNDVIDVYAGGVKPNYPAIDSISFNTRDPRYLTLLQDVRQDVRTDVKRTDRAFYVTLLSAVRLLEINERWDAAQLEPLISQENKAAYEAIAQTNFANYPYSLLLTLGAGPEVYDQPISPGGMLRSRMAARSYFEGLAPFIIVSGGRVHPYKTPYIEALEMKKYLMNVLHVPEKAILIDPHARHTTTNLRNTARIMLQYGFPKDKFAIINSSVSHINAVEKMAPRCMRELGYVPYELGKRVSEVIVEFKPKIESLTIDPDEPLDP